MSAVMRPASKIGLVALNAALNRLSVSVGSPRYEAARIPSVRFSENFDTARPSRRRPAPRAVRPAHRRRARRAVAAAPATAASRATGRRHRHLATLREQEPVHRFGRPPGVHGNQVELMSDLRVRRRNPRVQRIELVLRARDVEFRR
jgi:hypothetical protein